MTTVSELEGKAKLVESVPVKARLFEAKEKEGELESAIKYYDGSAATGSREPIVIAFNKNWRGRPLVNYETIVNLISSTTTRKGLIVKAALDENKYETGIEVSDEQMAKLKLVRAKFHGDWNYTIKPHRQS